MNYFTASQLILLRLNVTRRVDVHVNDFFDARDKNAHFKNDFELEIQIRGIQHVLYFNGHSVFVVVNYAPRKYIITDSYLITVVRLFSNLFSSIFLFA